MITAAERRAKIEKLRRDREAKEKERLERVAQQKKEETMQTSSNRIIDQILAHNTEANEHLTSSQSMATAGQVQQASSAASRLPLRVSSHVVELEILGRKPVETYSKEITCDIIDSKAAGRLNRISEEEEFDSWQDDFDSRFDSVQRTLTSDRPARRSSNAGSMSVKERQNNKLCPKCQEKKDVEEMKAVELPKTEAEQIMKNPDFKGFFDTSSRIIERALGQEFNLMENFFAEEDEGKDNERLERGSKLHKKFVFQDKVELNRAVTSIDWSPSQPEILLASYSKSSEWNMDEPDGLIDIFSIGMMGRPELTLNCQYEITKAMFNPHNPNIVIGSTMSGYLLEWDIRAKKEPINGAAERKNRSQPIQKSCLAANGHQYPVYCLSVIGYHNQHQIVSISNDGKMCNWRPTVLVDPHQFSFLSVSKEVQNAAQTAPDQPPMGGGDNRQAIYAHSLDFTEGEQEVFYVGSEDFKIYQCNQRTDGFVQRTLDHHNAPVTSVHVHPGVSQSEKHGEMGELLLSSSMDWTVKLWCPNTRHQPLMTFESAQEYVYDARWCPTHPSVFASCDAEGFVDIWNINTSSEMPIVRKQITERSTPLNCLRWSKDGRRIAVGDSKGQVTMLACDPEIYSAKQDDFDKIVDLVQQNS